MMVRKLRTNIDIAPYINHNFGRKRRSELKPLRKIRLSRIIIVYGALWLCTGFAATTVNQDRQFLEVWNGSDKGICVSAKRYSYTERRTFRIGPRERKRFPDALEPGHTTLELVIGTSPSVPSKNASTGGFQVNNYGNKTWLHGKLLTIWPKEDFNVENVLLLHGVWRMVSVDTEDVYELDISHTEPHFYGSMTHINTGEEAPISGTMADQTMNFKISFRNLEADDARMETSELRVYPNGLMEGYLNASYVEEGERKKWPAPIRFEADFEKKELVFKGYQD